MREMVVCYGRATRRKHSRVFGYWGSQEVNMNATNHKPLEDMGLWFINGSSYDEHSHDGA